METSFDNVHHIRKKKKASLFKRTVAWLHLWPSIIAGIVLIFVCFTGTVIVYADEIMDATAGSARYNEVPVNPKRVSHYIINDQIQKLNPNLIKSEYVFFKDPKRSIRIRTYDKIQNKLMMIYMDSYTGKILKVDKTIHFFFVMAKIHATLLAGEIGHWVVAISTIVFVLSTLTGLILWWPKRWNKTTRNASFTIRWKAKFKRLNYDLHNVYGFYSLIICFLLGLTGLMIFFFPLMKLAIISTGGTTEELKTILPIDNPTKRALDMVPFAYHVLEKEFPDKESVSIWNSDIMKVRAYIITSGKVGLKSIEDAELTIYDRYTGKKILLPLSSIQHEKTKNIVWQLHMGQWWGQLGKLSTFFAGLVATSLPITGFLIWWGKRKKTKKKI